jgi:hypothetical protein
VIGLTTREGAIIERVRTGTPARWASNHENPLASSNAGVRTVVVPHLAHGGGDGWNSNGMTRWLPDFQAGARGSLSHRRLAQGTLADDAESYA